MFVLRCFIYLSLLGLMVSVLTDFPVCVSSLMIDEIKRIIKDSEIIKFVSLFLLSLSTPPEIVDKHTGKTTPNGHRRTRTDDKNSRSD